MQEAALQDKALLAGQAADTAPCYQASDGYTSTSVQIEGYSLTTAEALACGIPAVVPNDDAGLTSPDLTYSTLKVGAGRTATLSGSEAQ